MSSGNYSCYHITIVRKEKEPNSFLLPSVFLSESACGNAKMWINLGTNALLLISEVTTSDSKTIIEHCVCCGDTGNQEFTYLLHKCRCSVAFLVKETVINLRHKKKQHKRIKAMKNNVFNIADRLTAMRLLSLHYEAPNVITTNNFFPFACTKMQAHYYHHHRHHHHGPYSVNSLLLYK